MEKFDKVKLLKDLRKARTLKEVSNVLRGKITYRRLIYFGLCRFFKDNFSILVATGILIAILIKGPN